MEQKLVPILDNGHGKNTAGKRSPVWKDGTQLFEYEFTRDIVRRIGEKLTAAGVKYRVLVPEVIDISLGERVRRANRIYEETNDKCFLVSVHANAGGGTGWEVWTSKGQTKSDAIATTFFECCHFQIPTAKMRKDMSDGDVDKESDFYILAKTKCPAILTENFFMDDEIDCRYIMSEQGRDAIAEFHKNAIMHVIR